ncbi:MAG: hypothetical protein DIU70_003715 [Bacillota bacterium]
MSLSNGRPPEVQAAVALERIEALREDLAEIREMLGQIDERLRRLEEWRSWVLGAAAAVGATAGWLSRVLTDRLMGR